MQVLAPDNLAFNKIPSTALNKIFDQGDTNGIISALRYHFLNGTRKTSDLVPGTLYGVPTLLTSSNYTNVTGGQRVTNVKQSGDIVVFISGLGTRCEVKEKVRIRSKCLGETILIFQRRILILLVESYK